MAIVSVLGIKVDIDQANADAVFTQLSAKVEEIGQTFSKLGPKLKSVGLGLTTSISAPIAAIGGSLIKLSADFERAMNRVGAVTGATGAEFKTLEQAALDMGLTSVYSATQAANALEELAKAGLDAPAAIAALPSVLDLATISGESLATTAVQMTDTLVQFGLAATDSTRVADALAKAANASTIDVHDLGQSFKYSAIVASAFGLSVEQAATYTALFGRVGVKAEMAGTALRNVLYDITKQTKGMSEVLDRLGLKSFRDTRTGAIDLAKAIQALAESADPIANTIEAFGKRAGPPMVKLVQDAMAGGTAWKEMIGRMADGSVTAQGVADKMNSGLIATLTKLKNIATTTGIEIGQELQPTFDKIVAAATKLAGFIHDTLIPAFQALPQPVKDFLVYAGLFAVVLGPATYVIGEYVTTIGGVVKMLGETAIGMRALTLVTGLLGKAWASLGAVLAIALEPWFWIPALIAGAVAAVRYFTGSWAATIDLLSYGLLTLEDVVTAWELIKMGASALWGVLQTLGRAIWDHVIVPFGQLVVKLYDLQRAFVQLVIQQAITLWNALGKAITDVANSALGKLIGVVAEYVAKVAGWSVVIAGVVAFHLLYAIVMTTIDLVQGLTAAFIENLRITRDVVVMIAKFAGLLAGEFFAVIKTVVGWFTGGLTPATQEWGRANIWVADVLINVLLYAIEQVLKGVDELGAAVLKYVDFLGVIPAFKKFSAAALQMAKDAVKAAKDTVAAAREAARKSIAAAQDAAKGIAAAMAKVGTGTGTGTATGTGVDPKEQERLQKLFDSLYGNEAIAKARDAMKVFAMLPDQWRISERAMAEYNDTFWEGMEAMRRQGQKVPQEFVTNWLNTLAHAKFETHKILTDILDPKKIPVPNYWQWANQFVVAPIESALAGLKWENHFGAGLEKALRDAALRDRLNRAMDDLVKGLSDWGAGLASGLLKFEDAWKDLWKRLQGFAFSIFQGFFDDMLKGFQDWFKKALAEGNKFAGSMAGALAGAVAGFTVGKAAGKGAGIAAGAASGALVGYQFGSYYGAAIGAAVGAFAGWWGGRKREKELKAAMETSRQEIVKTFGGMEKLREVAQRFRIDIDRAFETESVEEFQWIVEGLQQAIAKEEQAVKKLGDALSFTAAQGALMSKELMNAINVAPAASQEGIFQFMQDQAANAVSGLGQFLETGRIRTAKTAAAMSDSIVAMYAELQRQGVAPSEAFRQLEPLINSYNAKMQEAAETAKLTGIAGSAAFQQLQVMAQLAAGEVTGPVMDSMAGLQQALTSTANLGLLNQTSFEGFGDAVYDAFKLIEAQGKGGEVALAAVQGPLQKLWELAQDFGYELTEDQKAMVEFGLEAGTIGDKFRPAADRMVLAIDALVERLDRFLDKIAELPDQAGKAAQGVEDALNNIDPKDIHQEYVLDPKMGNAGLPGGQEVQTALGTGGIVTRPTRALIGESGPEAVIPLPADLGGGADVTTSIYLDGELLARSVTKRQPGVLRAYGVVR